MGHRLRGLRESQLVEIGQCDVSKVSGNDMIRSIYLFCGRFWLVETCPQRLVRFLRDHKSAKLAVTSSCHQQKCYRRRISGRFFLVGAAVVTHPLTLRNQGGDACLTDPRKEQ